MNGCEFRMTGKSPGSAGESVRGEWTCDGGGGCVADVQMFGRPVKITLETAGRLGLSTGDVLTKVLDEPHRPAVSAAERRAPARGRGERREGIARRPWRPRDRAARRHRSVAALGEVGGRGQGAGGVHASPLSSCGMFIQFFEEGMSRFST